MSRFWKRVLIGWLLVMGLWASTAQMFDKAVGKEGLCKVGYVYDGDTVALRCGDKEQTARLVGFDTPETKKPKCEAERALGEKAKLRLRELLANGAASYRSQGHDKYGRELIVLKVDGRDVAETLVNEGLAVDYTGGGRISWCAKLGAGE